MAKGATSRYVPAPRRKGASTPPPDWFVREAIAAFELSHPAVIAMFVIADNLNNAGESRTSKSLISSRGRMDRGTAKRATNELVDHGLLIELDERTPGRMMRYAIPKFMPWNPR
jgi:hypothetical protein